MTNYSRSVLKSNGLHRSKNLSVKFGFSPKTVPANIAKKLPPQRCFKPLLIPIFNFSHKRPTFAFTSESGYTLGFRRKIAHKGTHGETGGVLGGGWYHYPRCALRAAETLDGRLSKGLICRFLRLPSSTPCAVTFSANMQISLSAISVANTFALWYDKS